MDSNLGDTDQCELKKRYNAMCCKFTVISEDGGAIDLEIDGKFCVTNSQRLDNRGANEQWGNV